MAAPSSLGVEDKTSPNLDPPKDDPIRIDYLSKCNGMLYYMLYYI